MINKPIGWTMLLLLVMALFPAGAVAETAGAVPFSSHLPIDGDMSYSEFFRHADLNGDGRKDIIVSCYAGAYFYWFERKAGVEPQYVRHQINLPLDYAGHFDVGDVDGDGDGDIISTGVSNTDQQCVVWYENMGGTNPSFTHHIISTNNTYGRDTHLADLDNDGDLDIVSTSAYYNTLYWHENNGVKPPVFTTRVISNVLNADQSFSVALADFDVDGDIDLATATDGDGKIAWHENKGGKPLAFASHLLTPTLKYAWRVAAADLDGDGDQDIMGLGNDGVSVKAKAYWYENGGGSNPGFMAHELDLTGMSNPYSIIAADLNNDGRQDILINAYNDDKVYYYENNGQSKANFTMYPFLNDYRPTWVIPADLDSDGDQDLISLNRGWDTQKNLFWYRNDLAGLLKVLINPPQAVAEGAQWRRVGTTAWFNSGETESGIHAGNYSVEFKWVSGWWSPLRSTVTITNLQTSQLEGLYTDHPVPVELSLFEAE